MVIREVDEWCSRVQLFCQNRFCFLRHDLLGYPNIPDLQIHYGSHTHPLLYGTLDIPFPVMPDIDCSVNWSENDASDLAGAAHKPLYNNPGST